MSDFTTLDHSADFDQKLASAHELLRDSSAFILLSVGAVKDLTITAGSQKGSVYLTILGYSSLNDLLSIIHDAAAAIPDPQVRERALRDIEAWQPPELTSDTQ